MNLKTELHQLNNRLEKARRKLNAAHERGDMAMIEKFMDEVQALTKKIDSTKTTVDRQLSKKGADIAKMAFSRPLTKEEQADQGALKKKVRGLVVVHPMTILGKEMGLTQMTGFAHKKF